MTLSSQSRHPVASIDARLAMRSAITKHAQDWGTPVARCLHLSVRELKSRSWRLSGQ